MNLITLRVRLPVGFLPYSAAQCRAQWRCASLSRAVPRSAELSLAQPCLAVVGRSLSSSACVDAVVVRSLDAVESSTDLRPAAACAVALALLVILPRSEVGYMG